MDVVQLTIVQKLTIARQLLHWETHCRISKYEIIAWSLVSLGMFAFTECLLCAGICLAASIHFINNNKKKIIIIIIIIDLYSAVRSQLQRRWRW